MGRLMPKKLKPRTKAKVCKVSLLRFQYLFVHFKAARCSAEAARVVIPEHHPGVSGFTSTAACIVLFRNQRAHTRDADRLLPFAALGANTQNILLVAYSAIGYSVGLLRIHNFRARAGNPAFIM